MNNLLLEKLEELFNELDNCDELIEMTKLKNQIMNDKELSIALNEYRKLDKYDSNKIKLKEIIINNPLIKKYRGLENELYFTVLEVNSKLNSLVDKKRCNSESH